MLKYIGDFEKLKDYGFEYIEEYKGYSRNCEYLYMGEWFEDILCIANEDLNNTPFYKGNVYVDIPSSNFDQNIIKKLVKDLIKDGLVLDWRKNNE